MSEERPRFLILSLSVLGSGALWGADIDFPLMVGDVHLRSHLAHDVMLGTGEFRS